MSSKIADIEVTVLRYEYPAQKGFYFAGGYCTGRLSCLVRVRTNDGVEGIGSVYSHPELVRSIVEDHLRDMLIGEDPEQIEMLWDRGYKVSRWYGRKGAAISALGGIDTALWDIRGKKAGEPVHRLLGSQRDSIPAYASALLWRDNPAELGKEAASHLAKGFRAMKMRLGRNYRYDRAALDIVRNAIGPENRLMVDGNGRYSLAQAERLAPEFRSHQVYWLEEPFQPEDSESYLALRPKLGIPLAAGENEFALQGFSELTNSGMVDIVQPDCSRAGGITECHKIAQRAAQRGRKVATHTWSDAVAVVANMHLVASLPNGLCVEVDQTGNPLVDELLSEALNVREGLIQLPQKPGLGISLNEAVIAHHTWPRGTSIPPGNYSDLVFGGEYYTPAPPYEAEEAAAG